MADIDGWIMPEWADLVDNPDKVIEAAIRDVLPPEFHGAKCYWQFSSSMGFVTGVLKVHLFFWLSEPASNTTLKTVLAQNGAGIDLAPFCAVQPHYIADPVIQGGADPLPHGLAQRVRAGGRTSCTPSRSESATAGRRSIRTAEREYRCSTRLGRRWGWARRLPRPTAPGHHAVRSALRPLR
jgi:hypothetical protein